MGKSLIIKGVNFEPNAIDSNYLTFSSFFAGLVYTNPQSALFGKIEYFQNYMILAKIEIFV